MRQFVIKAVKCKEILNQLNKFLKGEVSSQYGELTLSFNNNLGKGKIRCIEFDRGISLIDYDVCFSKSIQITMGFTVNKPIEFIFVSQGNIKHFVDKLSPAKYFEKFQNIIISNSLNVTQTYVFPESTRVKVNWIYVYKEFYVKNNNGTFLNTQLFDTFQDLQSKLVYNHYGNYSLKIADQIKKINKYKHNGIVKILSLEGRLNLIISMQILEYQRFSVGAGLSKSLSKIEIEQIYLLSNYIVNHVSEPLVLATLSKQSGLSAKKIQLGFKVLFSMSANKYIRHVKLELSRDLIMNSGDSISEIVYSIGFKSRSYFSKIFYEEYGILPTAYRKLNSKVV